MAGRGSTTPQFPQAPRTSGIRRDVRLPGGRELRPLRGPEVPLPSDQEAVRVARWEAFRARTAASYPEFICYEWLVLKKKLKPNTDFVFQSPIFGGRTAFGGFVLDFYFPDRRMAWFVQGLRYHFTKTTDRARDILAVAAVSARGINVVQLFEDYIITREEYTLVHAFRGEQISRRRM